MAKDKFKSIVYYVPEIPYSEWFDYKDEKKFTGNISKGLHSSVDPKKFAVTIEIYDKGNDSRFPDKHYGIWETSTLEEAQVIMLENLKKMGAKI